MDGHLSFDGSVKKIGLSSDEPHRIEPTLSRGEAERVPAEGAAGEEDGSFSAAASREAAAEGSAAPANAPRAASAPSAGSWRRTVLAALCALTAGGAFLLADYGVFGRLDYVSDVQVVDPVKRAEALIAEGKLKDAQTWIELYESLPGPSWRGRDAEEKEKLDGMLEAIRTERASLAYQIEETAKGFFLGQSEESYGRTAEALSSLFVVGDIRDLATAGINWAEGEEVDYFVAALSAAGLALTVAALGPQAPAAEGAKAGIAALKVAKRAGRVSPALEREVLTLTQRVAKGEAKIDALAEPLSALSAYAKTNGAGAALEVVGRSDRLADLPRVVRTAERFGRDGAAALRFGGKGVVEAVEKHGVNEVKAVLKYGEDAVGKLARFERVSAKALLRDMRRVALFSGKAIWRGVHGAFLAAGWFASVLGALLSAALLLKSALAVLLRIGSGLWRLAFGRGPLSK